MKISVKFICNAQKSENPPKTNANATVAKHSQVEPTYTDTLRHTHNQRGYIELSVAKQQTERIVHI